MHNENNAEEPSIANKELGGRRHKKRNPEAALTKAYKDIVSQIEEKEEQVSELALANLKRAFENDESEKSASGPGISGKELIHAEADARKRISDLEQKETKRTAQYSFISHINQTILHIDDQERLFSNSCRIALEFGKFKIAWIGSFNTAQKSITLLAHRGIPAKDIRLFTDAQYHSDGPQGIVLRTGTYYLSNDVEQSQEQLSWRPFLSEQGLRSCIALPLYKSGIIYGTFNLYAAEVDFFGKEDIELLIKVTNNISFALSRIEESNRQKEAEGIIIKNEKRFRALIENSSDMITLSSREGKLLYGSPSVTKLFGYSTEELLSAPAFAFIHPDDISEFLESRRRLLLSPGKSHHSQIRLKHKNGTWIWCEAILTNLLGEEGINAMVSNFRDISDKKSNGEKLVFDSNNLNALINNTNDLMWSVDKDFNLITSNVPFDEACKMNFGKAIAKGESILSAAFTPEMLIHFKQLYERAFAGEAFTEIEHFNFNDELWTQISYYPIRNGNEVVGTACHSRDITGIKNTEKQLTKSEAFNRGILNSLDSHIAVMDVSGNIIAVNDSWNRFAMKNGDPGLKYTSLGINYFSTCKKSAGPGDTIASAVLTKMNAIIDEKERYFYLEYPCHSPSEQRWFGMRAMKFESDIPMVIVAHTNISERKRAEDNLMYSEARLKEAQALTHLGNWEVDLLTNVNTWSDEFFNIYGITREEVDPSPESFLAMIHPDDYEFARNSVEAAFQTPVAGSFSARIQKKDGNVRSIYTEWKVEFDQDQKPLRLYGILQDVTERQIAQEEREKLINDTIQRNRDLEQFTYIVSHNLRAPTANIIGITETLQDETLTPQEHKALLHGLSTSVSALDTVIKDITTILQVKGGITENLEMISFTELVEEICVSIKNLMEKHHVRIKTDFSEVDEIFSLKVYVHSVFYNLIGNSIKYGKPGQAPLIEIRSKKEDGKTILEFKDNGLGIDMKTNGDKIFGLYKRFHSHVEGKGMGLFMVKTQVEAIGGTIAVFSEPGKGTVFTIVLQN